MLAPDGAERVEPGTFAIADDGARWVFSGGLTFDDATRILEESRSLPLPRSGHVDLSGLQSADSSALAVLMALKRRASAERHHKLVFEGLPEAIMALAHVYGIDELIDTARPAP
ncbi:MAG TPA: STAS domain-containing protein [Casimicrobiaceae bacterium]|nr:STAS domain-containing protein [Casimicrobiaceae bacterium]